MIRIRDYIKPNAARLWGGLTLKIIATMAEIILPLLLAFILDDSPTSPVHNESTLFLFGGIMLACALICMFGNIFGNGLVTHVARDATKSLRGDLFSKTLSLSARQIDSCTLPSLISRLSSDTYNVHNMIGTLGRMGIRVPVLLIGGMVCTGMLDPILMLIVAAVLVVLLCIIFFIAIRGRKLYGNLQRSVDGMVRKIRDDYTGVRVIKALSRGESETESFKGVAGEVAKQELRAGLWTGMSNPIVNLFLNLGMVGVILVGAYRVRGGSLEAGKIVAIISYFSVILGAAMMISRLFVIYAKGSASARRICEVLNYPSEPLLLQADDYGTARLEFRDVSFSYEGEYALKNISFALKKGERLGILGATGSGKTTLMQLLLRFYDATEGAVYIDGQNITSIPEDVLREKFGVVFQNDFIMEGTVFDNVDFCRGIDRAQARRALRAAQADFVFEKEEKMQFRLAAHGSNLSGGQRQRILIARALAGQPDILILDDSSSALDYRTDAALRASLMREYPQVTCVFIAQRISSLQNCDRILILDGGRAVGLGTSEELLQNCPVYREIAASQGGDIHE